jgi:hypothetical protein
MSQPATEQDPGDWRTVNAFGRTVTLKVGDTIDACGQFRVALLVDGKELYAAHVTDKSPEPASTDSGQA